VTSRGEGILEIRRHVVLRAARGHGIAQNTPRQGSNAVRGFVPATRFDTPKHNQQLLRRDRRHRPAAEVRIEGVVQPRTHDRQSLRRQRLAVQREPFLGSESRISRK
jgi:hypothetical protein